MNRRTFAKFIGLAAASVAGTTHGWAQGRIDRQAGSKIKLTLNAYSFNTPLRAGEMNLFDLVDYCADLGFDAVDTTGYYFPGYPAVPTDRYIYDLKRYAFINGLSISGTGIRNDFTVADESRRQSDIHLIKIWIRVAEKLGAPVIRIFAGNSLSDGVSRDVVVSRMAHEIKTCVEFGRQHGVIVAVQNHNHFLKTADETIRLFDAVDSEWFGVILDIGSLRQGDPYAEIRKLLPYAVSWQLKEHVWNGDRQEPVDLKRIKNIIQDVGYRGFLPVETLGEGDPTVKVKTFFQRVKRTFDV